jgi:hypothetical protein
VQDDGTVALGDRDGGGFETLLLAVGHAVKLCGRSRSRKPAGENAATGRTGRSNPVCCKARAENSREFRLGAGPRRGNRRRLGSRPRQGHRPRSLLRPVRLGESVSLGRWKQAEAVSAHDSVVPAGDGFADRERSPGSVVRHASVASVVRRSDIRGYSSNPGNDAAGTSIHSSSEGTAASTGGHEGSQRIDPGKAPGETENGPRERRLPSGQAAGSWSSPPPLCADELTARR